ncbi:MAG: tRNA-dihydrouridine synthase, partial [Clostridia bacterium]|nr:tRNA-dihydrouridine synthase [Clostridia bacterium]
MEYFYAPMEGITLSRFRQIHHEMFPGVSEYYTPFIAPDSNGGFRAKFLRELTTDCGQVPLIPQLLVNNAEAFCLTADRLIELGFREINLNVGCPSGTVFA